MGQACGEWREAEGSYPPSLKLGRARQSPAYAQGYGGQERQETSGLELFSNRSVEALYARRKDI